MLLLSFVLALSPAQPPAAAASTDLAVSSFYWGKVETQEIDLSSPFPRSPSVVRRRTRGYNPDVERIVQRETYVLVRNTGAKKIKAVTWDYVFYEDAKHEHELKRFQFRSKETIGPGEMKFLSVNVDEEAPSSYGDVEIAKLEFDDGSVWQRANE